MRQPWTLVLLAGGLCSLLSLGACAVPDRQPDLDNISANVAQARDGDFGAFLHDLNEAGDKAREAQEIHDDLAAVPPHLNADLNERERGVRLAEEAAEHRRLAGSILDTQLAHAAHLDSLHAPQNTEVVTRSVYFDAHSTMLDETGRAVVAELAAFLGQYPIADVKITGYADTRDSSGGSRGAARSRAEQVRAQLGFYRPPMPTPVAVEEVSEADGQAADKLRRVDILVAPHGTYDKGQ